MKFEFEDSFFRFFREHGIIEFQEMLSSDRLAELSLAIEESLQSGLKNKPRDLATDEELRTIGRDPWLRNPKILKILLKSQIGSLASFLFKKKPIRLAYMQALFSSKGDAPLKESASLESIASMTPILGGALICLQSPVTRSEEHSVPTLSDPRTGRILFFSAQTPIDFEALTKVPSLHTVLLCFCEGKVRYTLQPRDPHTHELKKSGYVFGDLIGEQHAPYLYR